MPEMGLDTWWAQECVQEEVNLSWGHRRWCLARLTLVVVVVVVFPPTHVLLAIIF